MTGTRRIRIVILSAIVFAVLLVAACFSVSYAKWSGNTEVTAQGSVGKFYVDYKKDENDKAVRSFHVDVAGEYKNYICVSNENGDAGTVYLVFDVNVTEGGDTDCWFRINRSETNSEGYPTGNLLNIDGPLKLPDSDIANGAFKVKPNQLSTHKDFYIPLNFTADNKYYALNFVINSNGVPIKFDFTAKVTTTKPATLVRFDPNGGYLTNGSAATQNLSADEKVARISAPARNQETWGETQVDFMFGGWFTKQALAEQNSSSIWNFDATVGTDDVTLYAKWIVKNDYGSKWYVSINGDLHEMPDVNSGFTPTGEWTIEHILTADLSEGDELRFYPEGNIPTLDCENGADIIAENTIDNSATVVTGDKYTLYYKVNGDKSKSALALVKATDAVTVKFDVGKEGVTIADQTIQKGGKVERPTDPAVSDSKTDIFIDWYTTKTVDGDNVTYSGLYDFDTAVNADITLYAKWHTVSQSLYLRKNDSTDFLAVDVSIAVTTTTVEGTLNLAAGDKVYFYNTWDSALPYEMKSVIGSGLSKTAGKPYLTADAAGTYTLQATQNGTEYTMVIADKWSAAEQSLANGTYIYLANATAETSVADRFIKMSEVGYIEDGATAQGVAAIMSGVTANTQIKLVTVEGGKISLAETSLTGKGATASKVKRDYTIDEFDGNAEFVTSHTVGGTYTNKYIVNIKNAGTYRVYLSPDNKLSVELAVGGITASTNIEANEYYAVGSFSDFKICSENKLNASTAIEGVIETGADFNCNIGDVYRLAKIESVTDGVPTVSYATFDAATKGKFVSGDSCVCYDEWADKASTTPFTQYRIIVDGATTAPTGVKYRNSIDGADKSLSGFAKITADGYNSGYYADVAGTNAIYAITVNGGGEISKLSVGDSFAFTGGKSYRIKHTGECEASYVSNYAAYQIDSNSAIAMVSTTFTGTGDTPDHNFETVLTVSKGNKIKFTTGGTNGNCSDLWIDKSTPCENNTMDGNGTNTSWHTDKFSDKCTITINANGIYKFYFRHYGNDGTKWCVSAEKLTSVTENELGKIKVGTSAAQSYRFIRDGLAYENNNAVRKVVFSIPQNDGDYYLADLYTLDSKATENNYIAPGESFVIYRYGRRVSAKIHSGDTLVDDVYRITHKAGGYTYTINTTHGGAEMTAKVKGKFIIGLSPADTKVSVNFIGGDAATEEVVSVHSAETEGAYLVGSFSNWQVYKAFKLSETQIKGVYAVTVPDCVITNFDDYKIVYWARKNGLGDMPYYGKVTGGQVTQDNMMFDGTVEYFDMFKAGTVNMYPSKGAFNSIARYVFYDGGNKVTSVTPALWLWKDSGAGTEVAFDGVDAYYGYRYKDNTPQNSYNKLIVKSKGSWSLQSKNMTLTKGTDSISGGKSYYIDSSMTWNLDSTINMYNTSASIKI